MICTRTLILVGLSAAFFLPPRLQAEDAPTPTKKAGVLFPQRLIDAAQQNIAQHAWARRIRDAAVAAAEPFLQLSDEQLWDLMFGPTITRSWMVWSDGHCPACNQSVPMYNWRIDAIANPWKVQCPHCRERFPKNDFHAFYRSGLDERGIFDPNRADRRLLVNADHPGADDPLRDFGVDDGEGYVDGDHRWRFIGAYLIYGQWKQAVLGGTKTLADAYTLTRDSRYAHKAGVLLDRVADLYPTLDFKEQAVIYEKKLGSNGYVSVWHDACPETQALALAYDQVFDAIRQDPNLVTFLSTKAEQYGLDNPKASFHHVQRNIEDRILRDALTNRRKINSNYPQTDIAIAVIKTVLGWPDNKPGVLAGIDAFVKKTTAVDGVTGEKGLANYTAFAPQSLALFLGLYDRMDPTFLPEMIQRHPLLQQTYRFHIDTWCLDAYYPLSGDTGWFAGRIENYQGVRFSRPGHAPAYSHHDAALAPSMFTFLYRLAELTDDRDFIKLLYRANDRSVENLPYDLFAADGETVRQAVIKVLNEQGDHLTLPSVNKQNWHLAILRAGRNEHPRAVWLDDDSGGAHGHADGMNLGLFAKGLDLMPDFGYPPVQFGGWGSPKSTWYRSSAAHNTVVVDGKNHQNAAGRTTLWAIGRRIQATRAAAPKMIAGHQFERTITSIDISDRDAYLLDVFRVVGGSDHARFMHSHFGDVTTQGLSLQPTAAPRAGLQMRNFKMDPSPHSPWSVDWSIDDRYGFLSADADVHLRYTDLTTDAQAFLAEGWIVAGLFDSSEETWIPRVMTRRRSKQAPLASTFVAVMEPYDKKSNIESIHRLSLTTPQGAPYPDNNVAVEISLTDGRKDVIITPDVENPRAVSPAFKSNAILHQKETNLQTDAELCWIRRDAQDRPRALMLCRGRRVKIGDFLLELHQTADKLEMEMEMEMGMDNGKAVIRTGDPAGIKVVSSADRPLEVIQE